MQKSDKKSFQIGMTRDEFEKRKILRDGEQEISEVSFNLTFAGVLFYGFVLNFIMVLVLRKPIWSMLVRSENPQTLLLGFTIGYFVCCLFGSYLVSKPTAGISFVGFNFIAVPVGVLLTIYISAITSDMNIVLRAVTLTALDVAVMALLATLFPKFFIGLGRILGVSLLTVCIVSLISAFIPGLSLGRFGWYDWAIAGLFTLYIGYDWSRLQQCARTRNNAVDMATAVYLDIINVFIRILSILSKAKSRN